MKLEQNQFALRRLLVNLTVLALVLGFATAFPGVTLSLILTLLLFSPAVVISVFAIWRSARRGRTIAWLLLGLFIAVLATPKIMANWGRPPTFWELFMLDFSTIGIGTGLGAFVSAIVDASLQPASQHPT